jgi:hypothetical protein
MADDELKLRITPEVDEDALKRAQAEIDGISGKVNLGGKGKGSGVDAALKAELATVRATIDANDLKLRKFVANSLEEENLIRKKQALNQLTAQQANTLLAQESNARENMVSETVAGYQLVEKQLASLDQANQQVINRQKQLFYAQERAQSGFSSMSRSMGGLTSSTKDANIAFANFGRIVQDAPFGLLGISNNIDPLLVSFAQLKATSNGTGGALKALAGQLLGPAGLIFLLGSALPTALLFAQKYFKDTEKETNLAADAVKRVREEFAKLSAQAAGKGGIGSVTAELTANAKALDSINQALDKYEENERIILALRQQDTVTLNGVVARNLLSIEQRERLNQLVKENQSVNATQLRSDKAIIEANTAELELTKAQIEAQNDITSARRRYGVAVALSAEEQRKANEDAETQRKKDQDEANRLRTKAEQDAEDIRRIQEQRVQEQAQLERSLSQLLDDELTQRIKREQESVQEILNNVHLSEADRITVLAYYNNIEQRLTQEHKDKLLQIEIDAEKRKKQAKLAQANKDKTDAERIADEEQRRLEATQDFQLQVARISGEQRLAVEKDYEIQAYDLDKRAKELGLSDTKEFKDALVALERQKFNDLTAISIAETATIAKGGLAIAESIFGESKLLASANVAISTIEGAFAAYANTSKLAPFPFGNALGLAASAVVVSQGMASIKEINKKRIGDSSVKKMSGGGGASIASATQRPFVTDAISPSGANIAGRIGAMNNQPQFNVTATVDRMGLALAVRDGESDISTRQIPFAS